MSDWVKVGIGLTWDYIKEKDLEGTYVSKRENVGPNNSNMYDIRKAGSSVVGVWGSTLLDDKFNGISIGEDIRIVYLGLAKGEKTGREYHNFDVYHKPTESKK